MTFDMDWKFESVILFYQSVTFAMDFKFESNILFLSLNDIWDVTLNYNLKLYENWAYSLFAVNFLFI